MSRFDLYLPGASWLHRTDARVKLLFAVISLVLLLANRNLWLMAGTLLLLILLHLSAGVAAGRLGAAALALAPVSALMFALRTIFYPSGALLAELGPIRLTAVGAAEGAVVGLRLLAMALAVLLWLFTTSARDLVRSLLALGLPYSWGLAFSLALRFLPTFAGSFEAISQAQRARGLELDSGGRLQQLRQRVPIFVPMLISVFRDSERMAIALEARGFGAQSQRSDLHPLQLRISDAVLAVMLLLLLLLFLRLHASVGLGAEPLTILYD